MLSQIRSPASFEHPYGESGCGSEPSRRGDPGFAPYTDDDDA